MDKTLCLERTKPANPSKLGVFLACRLRYVFETERPVTKIVGEHPSALLGTAVHHAAELLRRKMPVEPSASVVVLEQCISRLLSHSSPPRQLIGWMLGQYGKNALLPRAQFISQAGFAWTLAQRLPPRGAAEAAAFRDRSGPIPIGLERRLASVALDMAGRADEIYWAAPGHIRIVDFKTGSIRDSGGNPKRNYVLQLAAYGLAVRELDQSVAITLELLGKGDRWIEPLEAPSAQAASQLLADLRRALPRGSAIPAASLACIGDHCGQCAYRPSCPAYLEHLEREAMIDHGFYGFDICGTLASVAGENGFHAMRLLLPQGFVARISRIPAIVLPAAQCVVGAKAIAFGIRSLEPARRGSLPQNFSVIDVQHPRNSAFQSCFHVE